MFIQIVNSCYVPRAVGVKQVSNSKSDLQGHSRALAMVPFDRSHVSSYESSLQLSLSSTVSEILLLIFKNFKRSRDSEHIPFGSNISCMLSYSNQ